LVLTFYLWDYARSGWMAQSVQKRFPEIVLGTGIIFSLLVFWDIYSLVTARSRAVGLAEKMTEDLRLEIVERKHAEAELARSNEELERFAYVASHDLQEPLRMISSYTQLIEKRYRERLDAEAGEFMGYVTDGAARMKQLINDLLSYARVGTRGREFQPTPCEAVVKEAVRNLEITLKDAHAAVTYDPLPEVLADSLQLTQLFQNLIGNAVKFHGNEPPCVHISAVKNSHEWTLTVRDNGIGIDPKYAEKIFVIFQRLHTRNEYPGTGIGLAICKKIIERHGGRIWLESGEGRGATFYFTLPVIKG